MVSDFWLVPPIQVTRRDMAEGGYDPCECVCTHEYAMRRLINLVRAPTPSTSGITQGLRIGWIQRDEWKQKVSSTVSVE